MGHFTDKTRLDIIFDVIRELSDFGEEDWLAAALTTTTASFTATDSLFSQYKLGTTVEIEQEMMRVTADATSTTVAVRRAVRGTSDPGVDHANGTMIRINPRYPQFEIVKYLNIVLSSKLERDVVNDATTTTSANTYLYDLPTGITADNLVRVFIRSSATDATAETQDRIEFYRVNRGQGTAGVDQIEFRYPLTPSRYLKFVYRGNYSYMDDDTDSVDLPHNPAAQSLPVLYICSQLLRLREAHRLRRDFGSFPDGATPSTARERMADWYMEEFNKLRLQTGLAPSTLGRSRLVGW